MAQAGCEPLPTSEKRVLERLEETIAAGLAEFLRVGTALWRIKSERLWRGGHASFEAYLRARWDMGKSYAYRLIAAALVDADLAELPIGQRPDSERVSRPLTRLDPAGRRQAWSRAVAADHRPTAAGVEEAAESVRLDRLQAEVLARKTPAEQHAAVAAGERAADARRDRSTKAEIEAAAAKARERLQHYLTRGRRVAERLGLRWCVGGLDKLLARLEATAEGLARGRGRR